MSRTFVLLVSQVPEDLAAWGEDVSDLIQWN
jgi:hypothetical protein